MWYDLTMNQQSLENHPEMANAKHLSEQIGQAIARQRQKSKLTQAQVAERLGVSNDAISRMERGNITPSIHRLVQFAQVFDCQTADLLGQASPALNDQAHRLTQLLAPLNDGEREQLLLVVEEMVRWRLAKG